MRFFEEDPTRARFLVVEVNGAGSGAQARRDRILQRLADILDGGRGEARGSPTRSPAARPKSSPARSTARSSARIETGSIERGEDFLPELVYMAVMPYLGARAAEDELLVQSLR